MYHRVAERDVDPWGLAVTRSHLAEHLAVLRCMEVVEVDALTGNHGRARRPRVAVTFDDGYADTLAVAADLLQAFGIPATVFVNTAGVSGMRHFWWDELAEVFLRPGRLPRHLNLRLGRSTCAWDLGADASYSSLDCAGHRAWRVGAPLPSTRHAVFLELWQRLIRLRSCEQHDVIATLRAWANQAITPGGRLLTGEEISCLGAREEISIGGHTVHHVALPEVDDGTQRLEISQNRLQLQALTGSAVDHFAYPFGQYGARAATAVRAAGFTSAATTDPEPLGSGCDPFAVPRFQVPDVDGTAFAGWVHRIRGVAGT